jgi:hypothetical protein
MKGYSVLWVKKEKLLFHQINCVIILKSGMVPEKLVWKDYSSSPHTPLPIIMLCNWETINF